MNAPSTDIQALAHQLAESAARSDIECYCTEVIQPRHPEAPNQRWYDTHQVPIADGHPQDREFVAIALQYLEGRGLLIRSSAEPHIVSFRNQGAP